MLLSVVCVNDMFEYFFKMIGIFVCSIFLYSGFVVVMYLIGWDVVFVVWFVWCDILYLVYEGKVMNLFF